MRITELPLSGAAIVTSEFFLDHRGIFSRFFCTKELSSILAHRQIVNVNFSRTNTQGAIRGLHIQRAPYEEMKLVRCLHGKVYDVIVDLRPDSTTYLKWYGELLTPEAMNMMVVPEGFAHGFQALEAGSELLYLTTAHYERSAEYGLRFNDPAIGISWPQPVSDISEKDASHPPLEIKPSDPMLRSL